MKFSEYLKKEMAKDPKLKAAIEKDRKRLLTPAKKHDSRRHSGMGAVGAEQQYCFECQKMVRNPDYAEEQRALKRIAKRKK